MSSDSSCQTIKGIFDLFPSLFSIKRDAIDKYPLWRSIDRENYYVYIGQRIMDEFEHWEKSARPYLEHCERKAQIYDSSHTKVNEDE